jgi:hypothetical protein
MLKSLLPLTGGLITLAIMLILAIYAVLGVVAGPAAAEPVVQGIPAQGLVGTTNQNNCSGYMASYGYRVDAVGLPSAPTGGLDHQSVVMLMPLQSTNFQPGRTEGSDSPTQQQLSLGFAACAQYYPGVPLIRLGLEQAQSILMFSAEAADVQAVQNGTMSTEEFWSRVQSTKTVLDARTGRPISDINFVNKDFSGQRRMTAILPPNAEPPSKGKLQIRLQSSTAYLALGGQADLVATVLDSSGQPLVGRSVSFTYTPIESDPLTIGSENTGADGAARIRFTAPQGLQGAVLIGASTSDSSGNFAASIPVTVGLPASGTGGLVPSRVIGGIPLPTETVRINLPAQPVTGTAPISVITASLRLQGYSAIDSSYLLRYLPNATATTMLAEIVAPRFDLSVRAEILSMAGTLLSTYPTAQESVPVLLYRNQGRSFLLIFQVARSDLELWLAGSIDEATLWQRIPLSRVIDASTGLPMDVRDFLSKNFANNISANIFVSAHQVTSTITRESWGDQLRTGRFQVPLDSTAATFSVVERTPTSEFAIYGTTDPINPVYQSSGDADGSKLRALRLKAGQYVLSITAGNSPSTVSLSYLEELGNP